MNETSFKKVVTEAFIENTAQGIFHYLKEIENKREIYEKHWVWELLQNALDAAPAGMIQIGKNGTTIFGGIGAPVIIPHWRRVIKLGMRTLLVIILDFNLLCSEITKSFSGIKGYAMSIVKRLLWFVRDFFAVNWMTEKVQLKQIKEMQDITEIRAYCATLYITWFGKSRLLKSKSFVRCNDYDKIKIITESIRKLEVQKNCFCAHMSHLCFKDKSGFFHCVEYSADPQSKAIEIGGYIDNSGVLYDALQNAGLVGPPLTEQQNPNKPPHSK